MVLPKEPVYPESLLELYRLLGSDADDHGWHHSGALGVSRDCNLSLKLAVAFEFKVSMLTFAIGFSPSSIRCPQSPKPNCSRGEFRCELICCSGWRSVARPRGVRAKVLGVVH